MYRVLDTEGKLVQSFPSWPLANNFRHLKGRPDWDIKKTPNCFRESTPRQRAAVRYCENWLEIKFTGDITNFQSCHDFLSQYLELAKATEHQNYIAICDEVGECDPMGLL